MSILLQTGGVAHLAIRVSDIARAKQFYLHTLGFAPVMDTDAAFVFLAGSTVIGVLATDTNTVSGTAVPFVGLDHLALSCDSDAELRRVAGELTATGVINTGIKTDAMTGKEYVAFSDPDGIWWEYYRS